VSAAEASADGGLVVEALTVDYGTARALTDVSLTARGRSVLAVLGVNGAGKSTLGRAIAGLVPAQGGRVYYDGDDITGWTPHRIRRAGLTYIPESRGIFPGLTVIDNIKMAVRQLGSKSSRAQGVDLAFDAFPALQQRQNQRASSLSGGEQQMLAIARAVSVRPRLIVADEMSLGLAPKLVEAVLAQLESAHQAGTTIVLIEQFVQRTLARSDDCIILNRGSVAWSGRSTDAAVEVVGRYLGTAEPVGVTTDR
jgi:branched-chain amino acid transport system ATP-binding protein